METSNELIEILVTEISSRTEYINVFKHIVLDKATDLIEYVIDDPKIIALMDIVTWVETNEKIMNLHTMVKRYNRFAAFVDIVQNENSNNETKEERIKKTVIEYVKSIPGHKILLLKMCVRWNVTVSDVINVKGKLSYLLIKRALKMYGIGKMKLSSFMTLLHREFCLADAEVRQKLQLFLQQQQPERGVWFTTMLTTQMGKVAVDMFNGEEEEEDPSNIIKLYHIMRTSRHLMCEESAEVRAIDDLLDERGPFKNVQRKNDPNVDLKREYNLLATLTTCGKCWLRPASILFMTCTHVSGCLTCYTNKLLDKCPRCETPAGYCVPLFVS